MTRLSLFTAIALLAGCSDEPEVKCHPVAGQVLLDNQPVAEVRVVFHPTGTASASSQLPRPLGITDQSGKFRLTTISTHDGAPPGDYQITVELRAPRRIGDEVVRDGANQLPAKYGAPQTSPLTYKVVEGENVVPVINISRGGR